ncbi:MAG: ornithine carbamoyltransferase, partial [Coriobacteriia bacterium]|nr:ornithine carbamoyltransferase [Coriobacteriia bacterium]
MKKDFLTLLDYSAEEITELLDLADQLKYETKHKIEHHILKGKVLAMIFEKASTRTRASFETGMFQLGGHALFISSKDSQIGRGEPIEDTARVLSGYVDGIMIRTFEQETVETLAQYASVPVINGLTDFAHPCQVLADLMTIREVKGVLSGLKLCYIGDGNNMANSLIVGCLKLGMSVSIACPQAYKPAEEIIAFAQKNYPEKFELTDNVELAASQSDVLYTDVWASMGQEDEALERKKIFKDYQINHEILAAAHTDAMVLHCLPAHRGEEISADAFEAHAQEIFA